MTYQNDEGRPTDQDERPNCDATRNTDQEFQVSLFTAEQPDRLSKAFRLGENDELIKEPGGNLVEGLVETVFFKTVAEFAARVALLNAANAMAYGTCGHEKAKVVTKKKLKRLKNHPSGHEVKSNITREALAIVARNRDHFKFSAGPAIMMIDYDTRKGVATLNSEELLEILYEVCPELKGAPHVVAPSASSHIYKDGVQLRGPGGLRVFVLVQDGSDIPRAGDALFKRLWLAGHGYIAISSAGTMLVRTLVDGAVWQPERLDFVGGAACEPPLEQRRPEPVVYNNEGSPLNTQEALPSLSLAEEQKINKLIRDAKKDAEIRAIEVRDEWISRQVNKRLEGFEGDEEKRADLERRLRKTYLEAASYHRLLGDFELETETGDRVTVTQLLNNPSKYDGMRFADPLEPGYRNDKRIAKAFLKGRRPCINSFAHGGQRYTLHRQRREIELVEGERDRICREAMAVIRQDGSIFERGGEMVRVGALGEIIPLDLDGLQLLLDRLIMWIKIQGKTGADGMPLPPTLKDCPAHVPKGILAMKKDGWDLPCLTAVVTAPTIDPKSGRIIDSEGYDLETGLYLICNELHRWPGIPEIPNREQVVQAFKALWEPFEKFPFCDPVGRGVFLGAVLTTPVRVALPTSPGTLISSCTPSSGKSLLSRCLAKLVGEAIPTIISASENNEEMRKSLLALGRSGCSIFVLDNLHHGFGSVAMCVWLTTEYFTDRVLQRSKTVTVPTRALTILNGNNVSLSGDICRRVLSCYLDPGVEEPWRRKFDLDPVFYCQENRLEMIASILTILRAGKQMGHAPQDRTGSFEEWSDLIRPAVLLINDLGPLDVADPIDSINSAFSQDPAHIALAQLLETWDMEFEGKAKSLSEVIDRARQNNEKGDARLLRILNEIAEDRGQINVKRLGHWIRKYRGRLVGGLKFEEVGARNNSKLYRVVSANGDVGDVGDLFCTFPKNNKNRVTQLH